MDGRLYVTGGDDGHASTASVQCYDAQANAFTEVAPMLKKREQHAAAVLGGRLYVTGGIGSTWQSHGDGGPVPDFSGAGDPPPRRSVERYDPAADTWERVASMHARRRGHAAAVCAGLLYVAGGTDDETILNSVERFDPAKNTWQQVAPMRMARVGCSAAVLDGELYVAGGLCDVGDEEVTLSSVERYDPLTDAWEEVAAMCIARDGLALCCC
jgi:N-acetylneuraminic acid mutarotase